MTARRGAAGGSALRAGAGGLVGAAALLAVVTLASRVAGFGRTLGFSFAMGKTCLGSAYTSANIVPNVLFEVVAGGALAGIVVPLLVKPFREGDRTTVDATASALLTWTLVVLAPLALLLALLAPQIAALLTGGGAASDKCGGDQLADTVTRMLVVFAPQVPLYGLAVVSAGVLQAQRRFLAAASAPLLSSAVVVAAYLWFGHRFDAGTRPLSALPRSSELVLTLGTTAGVVALAAVTLVPVLSSGIRLRPRLRFPAGAAPRARALATAGLAALVAQQLLTLLIVRLANHSDPDGTLVAYSFTWTLYLLPYAVLALPLATSAFPVLTAHAECGLSGDFAEVLARTTRAVVLAAGLGAGLLAGVARPASQLLDAGPADAPAVLVSRALVAFAPGLLGYALLAHLGRALYAAHAGRAAAVAAVSGWAAAGAVDLVLGLTLSPGWVVAGFGIGNSVGMVITGCLLLAAVRARTGAAGLAGVARAGATAVLAGLACAVAAGALSALLAPDSRAGGLVAGACAAAVGATAYGACAALVDRAALRELAGGLRRG